MGFPTSTQGIVHIDLALLCIFLLGLFAIALSDARNFRIPDIATYPLFLLGALRLWFLHSESFLTHLIISGLAGLVFVGLSIIYRRIKGRDGLGLGDAKLVAVGGIWIGPALAVAIAGGAALALVVSTAQIAKGTRTWADPIPLGTYLCIGIAFMALAARIGWFPL